MLNVSVSTWFKIPELKLAIMLTKFQFYCPQVVKISELCVLGQSVSQKIACFKKLMYLYETTSLDLCEAKVSYHHSVANASVRFLFPFLLQLLWLFLKNVHFVDLLISLLV